MSKKEKKEKKDKDENRYKVKPASPIVSACTSTSTSPFKNSGRTEMRGANTERIVVSDQQQVGEDKAPVETTTPELPRKRRKRKRKRRERVDDDDAADDNVVADEEETSTATKTSQVERTIYVEGIPFAASPDDVRHFFVSGGCADIEDCRLPVWQDSGRLRGYGHVVFASLESRRKALEELNGRFLQGRYLSIREAQKPKPVKSGPATSEPSKTIALHNLSYEADEADVEAAVQEFGTIAPGGVRVVRHSGGTQQSKGFCYVEFEDLDAAIRVMSQSIAVLGRPCRMDYDHGRVRASFRTADRKLWQNKYGNKKQRR